MALHVSGANFIEVCAIRTKELYGDSSPIETQAEARLWRAAQQPARGEEPCHEADKRPT